jgi:hypothetical protein
MSAKPARSWLAFGRLRWTAGLVFAAGAVLVSGQSGAGHSVGHFPSYYPDEIRIDTLDPEAAGTGLADDTLHAYVGSRPSFAGPIPAHVKSVRSLGAFLVLSFDKASKRFASAPERCSAARAVVAGLSANKLDGFIHHHAYPVTPYHADYLHHLDRIEAGRRATGGGSATPTAIAVGARGKLAEIVVQAHFGTVARDGADAVLEAVPVDDLVSAAGVQLAGWSGLPWIKEGWFHAYRLLAPGLDEAQRAGVEEIYQRLVHGELGGGLPERVELERRLVESLTADCSRTVVGYAPREEHYNEAYPAGAENIAADAIDGLSSAVFVRTAKLKEYPWNGKLQVGVAAPPEAAWNPVAGFTDTAGRLMWSAVSDPAMIPFPVNASWMPNRVQAALTKVEGRSGGIKVPARALRPAPGTGLLQPVGGLAFASEKVTYEVLASPFEDGTEQDVADILYPYAFLYRWGAPPDAAQGPREPRLAPTFAALEERLVGLEVLRVERTTHQIAEGLTIVTRTPVVEVYLRSAPGDEGQVAALAPPWSTVPWHLLVLMEEAVGRGYAAFSAEEAARRGVPWLDLVRDASLKVKLRSLITQFEREGYRPAALKALVSAEEARERWRALGAFADKSGHFLVANGPYRLKAWAPGSVVLEAVREMTYPLGFGTYDRFVNPPRAAIEEVTHDEKRIVVRVSAEMTLKGGRGYRDVKEPLLHSTVRGTYPLLVVSRYLLLDGAGKVLKVDKMAWQPDGLFTVDLPQELPPGNYTVMLAVFLDGNAVAPSARVLHIRRIGAPGSPG